MRTVGGWLVAAVSGLALLTPVAAAPPEDVAAYCRAAYPQVQFQVRCLNVENAAADRVSRSAASADRDGFNRCLAASPSWAAMESCLAQSARGAPAGGVGGGAMSPTVPGADPGATRPSDSARPPADTAGTAAPGPSSAPTAPTPGDGGAPSPSTTVLGPQPGLAAGPVEVERPTRPIPEADADRQLRSLLEREGYPAARCTKKQYGPGWVIICQ
jgi:hypothetical protein